MLTVVSILTQSNRLMHLKTLVLHTVQLEVITGLSAGSTDEGNFNTEFNPVNFTFTYLEKKHHHKTNAKTKEKRKT